MNLDEIERITQAADTIQAAAHRITLIFEDGYGGNGLKLIELLEKASLDKGWTPSVENINALPAPIRDYIHSLETNCDPAGEIRRRVLAEERVEQLLASLISKTEPIEA